MKQSLIAIFSTAGFSAMVCAGQDYAGKPYGGQPHAIPGIIQAEEYDVAPTNLDGITFHYNRPARKTAFRTTDDCIGLTRYGNGHVTIAGEPEDPAQVYLGYTHAGEWVKYSVHVTEPGTYLLGGKFASGFTNAFISVTFTPEIQTGPINIPTTAGYQPGVEVYHVWEKLDHLAELKLPDGDFVMTVKIEDEHAGGLNIDYLTFIKKAEDPPAVNSAVAGTRSSDAAAASFNEVADQALQAMKQRAEELKIKGVALVAYSQGDTVQAWSSKMVVVGHLSTSPSNNDAKGSNLLGIAYTKAAEMADTLRDSGSRVRPPKTGEYGWQGGAVIKGKTGILIAAFSGGASADDLKVSKTGLAILADKL